MEYKFIILLMFLTIYKTLKKGMVLSQHIKTMNLFNKQKKYTETNLIIRKLNTFIREKK